MRRRTQEKIIHIFLILTTLVMIVLRILLNEKGRMNPDSIRFLRFANVFPEIDNTTTPLGYPLSIKFFTFFGFDEFWSSKLVGILAYLFIIWFAWKKKYYFKETVITGALYSFVSIFSFTLSEALILPFIFLFLYVSRQIIIGEITGFKALLLLSLALISIYNIRYSGLFFISASFIFGVFNFRKKYAKTFITAAIVGFVFVIGYKILFIDYFNEKYVQQFLEIGYYPTSKLLPELFFGLTTSLNPFIHIANPSGGIMNIGIYGIGFFNLIVMTYVFVKNGLSETEKFLVLTSVVGVFCSFTIQYFYVIDALDYRLLTPFLFPIWLVYFKKLYQIFGKYIYSVAVLSLLTGFCFTWLSRGNFLENRSIIKDYLKTENLENSKINFFIKDNTNLREVQVAELISTVNSKIDFTENPKDTLNKGTLTEHKVLSKIKIRENKFQ